MQEEGESLWSHTSCFNRCAVQIKNLSHYEALMALKQGTKYGKLIDSLYLDPPKNFTKLMSRVQKFIKLDEAWSSIRSHSRISKKPLEIKIGE